MPTDDMQIKMFKILEEECFKKGFIRYEISNFSQKNYESLHNLNCWEQKQYIGYGINSHSYLSGIRFSNTEDINKYIKTLTDMERIDLKVIEENLIYKEDVKDEEEIKDEKDVEEIVSEKMKNIMKIENNNLIKINEIQTKSDMQKEYILIRIKKNKRNKYFKF